MVGKPQDNLVDLLREIELGPAMQRLTEKQQNFVYAMIESSGMSYAGAARTAGYSGDQNAMNVAGHRLAHDTRIQEAMREMGPRILNAGLFIAARYVLEVINDSQVDVKDRLKASEMVMNRTGMHATSEHKVAVTHQDETTQGMVQRITALAKGLGIDPTKLLGGVTIESEVEEAKVFDENDIGDIL